VALTPESTSLLNKGIGNDRLAVDVALLNYHVFVRIMASPSKRIMLAQVLLGRPHVDVDGVLHWVDVFLNFSRYSLFIGILLAEHPS